MPFLQSEPVRAAAAVVIAVVGLLQVLNVIDVTLAGNIVGLIALVTGTEAVRSKVSPV